MISFLVNSSITPEFVYKSALPKSNAPVRQCFNNVTMATTIARIGSANRAKVLVLLWLVQLATAGEPNPACKTLPTVDKDNEDKCCDVPEMFPNETLNACMEEHQKSSKPPLQKSCVSK